MREKDLGVAAGAAPLEQGQEVPTADSEETLTLAEHFAYLDRLRDSGATNMFGTRPYLMRARNLSADRAMVVLSSWMASNLSRPPIERARAAIVNAEGRS